MKLKLTFLAFAFCLLTGMTFAQRGHSSRGRSSSSHSSSHRVTSSRTSSKPSRVSKSHNNSAKTVHVRAYTKKNGTHVAAYNRRPPKRH